MIISPILSSHICSDHEHQTPCFDLKRFDYTTNKNVVENSSITLECYVQNKGPKDTVSWMHKDGLLTLDNIVVNKYIDIEIDTNSESKFNLKINKVDSTHNAGLYKCQIVTHETKNLEYNLEVLGKTRMKTFFRIGPNRPIALLKCQKYDLCLSRLDLIAS